MTPVYIESNFLLEIAFDQAESGACEQILELAELRRVQIVVPSFALVEPQWTVEHRTRAGSLSARFR